jgi:hypothetical protein
MNRLLLPIALAVMLVEPALTPPEHAAPAPVYHALQAPAYHPPQAPVSHPPQAPAYHPPQAPVYHPPQAPAYHPIQATLHPAPVHQSPSQKAITSPSFISNPFRWRRWGWNHGVIWYPVPYYWGGGFWGPWGLLATPIDYGSVPLDAGSVPLDVAPESPGAQLLQDYGLTQTQCGPPNLVVIWGPDNAPICAYPNSLVAPGNYEVDPETLTLHAR